MALIKEAKCLVDGAEPYVGRGSAQIYTMKCCMDSSTRHGETAKMVTDYDAVLERDKRDADKFYEDAGLRE